VLERLVVQHLVSSRVKEKLRRRHKPFFLIIERNPLLQEMRRERQEKERQKYLSNCGVAVGNKKG
jgi:hypothetical protein